MRQAPIGMKPDDVEPRELRNAFGNFVTGVTIVTTIDEAGNPRGMTANSYTSVSLDPPLILVCIDRRAGSFSAFATAPSFAVNILGEHQRALSNLFASKSQDKFVGLQTEIAVTGAVILRDALCWMDCRVHQRVPAGDHLLLIGEIQRFDVTPGTPLGYCRGSYIDFGLEKTVAETDGPLVFGCIAENNGEILLEFDEQTETWSIPTIKAGAAAEPLTGLLQRLMKFGMSVDLSFLFSVFQAGDPALSYVIYRGKGAPSKEHDSHKLSFFSASTLPWNHLLLPQIRTMLRRYFRERENDRFGVYVDGSDGGRIAMLDGTERRWE